MCPGHPRLDEVQIGPVGLPPGRRRVEPPRPGGTAWLGASLMFEILCVMVAFMRYGRSIHRGCRSARQVGRHRNAWRPRTGAERRVERVKGIEPSSGAWEALALPLSYTRSVDLDTVWAVAVQAYFVI